MRFATLRSPQGSFLVILTERGLLDASAAAGALGLPREEAASMLALIQSGERGLQTARRILDAVNARDARLAALSFIDPAAASFAPPIPRPGKVVCVGQNYIDHCREQGKEPPDRPIFFTKFNTCLIGHGEPIRIPRAVTTQIDHEAELAFVIGKGGRDIAEADAYKHVFGYMCLNDVSARDVQKADGQWVRAKSFDTFGPCGPYLVTASEIGCPHCLKIRCEVDGVTRQDSETSNLIFSIPFLIEYMSRGFTLEPGDVVSTGTPPGVGAFRNPPVWLQPGQTVSVEIEKIGRLTNPVQ